jgi:hypothetical protein
MSTLNQSTVGEFLDRFYSFNDAVLRKLEVTYMKDGERNVTVWIASRDANETRNDGWVCVRLVISRVQDFCFAEAGNMTAALISNGVHICWFAGIVGLDFGHFVDPPADMVELKSSKFFTTGSSVEWMVEPY